MIRVKWYDEQGGILFTKDLPDMLEVGERIEIDTLVTVECGMFCVREDATCIVMEKIE